jgi:hypothetical protein
MNDLIWDLFKQSGIDIGEDQEGNVEKFTGLIVKECANFVENTFDDDGGHASCKDYAEGLKEYFGVKE